MSFPLDDRLVLEGDSLRIKVSNLFDELVKNKNLAQTFIRNPVQVLASKILPSDYAIMSKQTVDHANYFLYSVLSNPKFTEWLKAYQKELAEEYNFTGNLPDKQMLRKNLAKSIIEYGDENIVYNILNHHNKPDFLSTIDIRQRADVAVEIEILIYGVAVACVFVAVTIIIAAGHAIDESINEVVSFSPNELRNLSEQLIKVAKRK